jgi:hypothetical protein
MFLASRWCHRHIGNGHHDRVAKEAVMKKVATVMLALVALVVFAAGASAQQPVEYTVTVKAEPVKGSPGDHFLTFSAPVHIPDVTLPAGTYIFSLLGASVVQVSNVDRTEYYAMFFTSPVLREEAKEDVAMTFVRTLDTAPLRINKWFLPNQTLGFEFLYSPVELRGER